MLSSSLWLALSIMGLSLITEDGATALAAGSAGRLIDVRLAFISCFLGIWLGDLGLYAAARGLGQRVVAHRFVRGFLTSEDLSRAEQWFQRRGIAALVLSRIVPGSRLPTYVAAGTLKMPLSVFAGVTAICGAIWVAAALLFAKTLSSSWGEIFGGLPAVVASTLVIVFSIVVGRSLFPRIGRTLHNFWRKYRRWEFWPAWLFYLPVAAMGVWFAVRYRGLALPTIANPSQRNGGLIGESKSEILTTLMRVSPQFVADAYLIPSGSTQERTKLLERLLVAYQIELPFVFKPDVGQRGAGFRKIKTMADAEEYLATVHAPVILQRYAPGPHEAGIFYYRLPNQDAGRIFAITEKIFPAITGDGRRTLRELIVGDERASLLAYTYLRRFTDIADRMLPAGESLRLVEAGNHCQGSIFRDGMHLYSEPLRAAIDAISRALPEFFIGRYDIRYESIEELRSGRGFKIIELNGSASEATSIYDSRNSLWFAYKTLYRQWQLVYQIGAMNRKRGYKASSISAVIADWFAYRKLAACYPAAD
ncbi:MAG: VTT domain-containing protein [Acidobacteriales bacterium]|nr:VTT domain-containing protein [Terriglobales bacterium]